MSRNNKRQGGRTVVGERLPNGYFDELTSLLYDISERAYGDVLNNPLPPSRFTGGALRVGDLALELTIDFRRGRKAGSAEATMYRSTLSECEPYPFIENAEIWSWKQFDLDLIRRRKTFEDGTSIVFSGGQLQLEEHAPSRRYKSAWQHAGRLAVVCSRDEFGAYMDNLQTIYDGLPIADSESEE